MDTENADHSIIPDPEEENSLGGAVFEDGGESYGSWYQRIGNPNRLIARHLAAINEGVCYG